MDKVHNPIDSECYTASPEAFISYDIWRLQNRTASYFTAMTSCRQFALLHLPSDGHYICTVEQARGIDNAMRKISMVIGKNWWSPFSRNYIPLIIDGF
jgi:hypothetical protein